MGKFVKGQVANPTGKPPESAEFKKAKALLREALIEVANKGFYESESALDLYLQGDIPVGIRAFLQQIKKGNVKFIEILMNRILGKCAEDKGTIEDKNGQPLFKIVPYIKEDEDSAA